jgi:hypothetical protein
MANSSKIILKKSSVSQKVPLSTDLDFGELALNFADGKLYFKNNSEEIKSFSAEALFSLSDLSITVESPSGDGDLSYNDETGVFTFIPADLSTKQDTLISGTNIKTINNQSILGEGNINIEEISGEVSTDETLTGDGTENNVLSVNVPEIDKNYQTINIVNKNNDLVSAKITNFLSNCLKISPETYKSNDIAKVFTKEDIISVLVLSREGSQIKAQIDANLADDDNDQITLSDRGLNFVVPLITRTRKGTLLNIFSRDSIFKQIDVEVKQSIDVLI